MDEWFKCLDWDDLFHEKNVDEKAHEMMTLIKKKTDEYFPLKQRKISSDNQPFYNLNLATLKRRKQSSLSILLHLPSLSLTDPV